MRRSHARRNVRASSSHLDASRIEEALGTLGDLLAHAGHQYDLYIIGGSALLLRGIRDVPTQDVDAVAVRRPNEMFRKAEHLPGPLKSAAARTANALDISQDWLNTGPADLWDGGLPDGWLERAEIRTYGGLRIFTAGRVDLVFYKLYAAADEFPQEGKHRSDLQSLEPAGAELIDAARWCLMHDASPGFRNTLLVPLLTALGVPDAADTL